MTEQEKLHHAKHYIDSLANGLNPLDGTPIPEQDIVNNVKISRCLFFVSDVLRKQLDGHEPKKVSEKDKKLFYITEEEKLQYVPSKTPIPASGISYKVNEILDEKKMRKVSYRTITTWLVKVGLMEEEDISDGKCRKVPTASGIAMGITKYTPSSAVGTVVYLACDGKYAGCIVIEDEIKADAPAAIKLLKSAGIRKTVMLTGDADAVGKKVAGQLHLDQVYTELLPADKVDRVESLLKQKSEKGMLAFVGDGINDAPVLARADVGIAMGGLGSDAAIEAADVVLMTDEPSKIAAVMKIARKTIRIANQNIVFALGVKFLVLILGALGYANMWAAVFADVGVSIIAILNAIRAMRVKLPDMPAGSTNQG